MSESLASEAGVLSKAESFQMPDVFGEAPAPVVSKFGTPYITFAHPNKKDEWIKLGANVEEGEMFLVDGERITKLPVAKVNIVKVKQYWVDKNAAGEVQRSSWTEKPWPWAEHMDAVVLLHLPDRIVVANVNPHTTKCAAFVTLAKTLIDAATPEWADRSPAHKETLVIPQPFLRFFGEISLASPRTGKKSGKLYRVTQCSVKPTTNTEAVALKAFIADPESSKKLQDAADRYTSRIAELEAKLAK